MIFVTSDLHGISSARFRQLLEKADFREDDYLFVLGDVIDRGEHGLALLLMLTQMPNAQLILGNHEAMMLSCRFLFQEVTEESAEQLTLSNIALMQAWVDNGGNPTIQAMSQLMKQDPDLAEGIWDFLRDAPLYDTLRVSGKNYILTHGGLGNFRPEKELDDYYPEELLMDRPDPSQRYFDRATVIFGHTPTRHYQNCDPMEIWQGENCIGIDCGGGYPDGGQGRLACLRLDDGKVFYSA